MEPRIQTDLAFLMPSRVVPQTLVELAELVTFLRHHFGTILSFEEASSLYFEFLYKCRDLTGLSRETVRFLLSTLNKVLKVVHRYGDVETDVCLKNEIDKDAIEHQSDDIFIAWENFLGSTKLIDIDGKLIPIVTAECLSSFSGENTTIVVTGETEEDVRHFPLIRGVDKCSVHFDLVRMSIEVKLQVDNETRFIYEKTGHKLPKRSYLLIEKTAKSSRIVINAVTTYHNPEGSGENKLSIGESFSEILFRYNVDGDVIKGVYRTRARNREEQAATLSILNRTLIPLQT